MFTVRPVGRTSASAAMRAFRFLGAGCAPESRGFRDHATDLTQEGASAVGLSTQSSAHQHEVSERLT
jgi:peroxiredoxin